MVLNRVLAQIERALLLRRRLLLLPSLEDRLGDRLGVERYRDALRFELAVLENVGQRRVVGRLGWLPKHHRVELRVLYDRSRLVANRRVLGTTVNVLEQQQRQLHVGLLGGTLEQQVVYHASDQ